MAPAILPDLFLSDQNRNEFFRKKADQKLFWRFIRADFLPSDKFCSKLRFRQFRKEVYEKFSAFFLHAGTHSEPGNLEYRDAGDTVVGKLQLSLFRQNLLIFNQKRNLRAHPNTRQEENWFPLQRSGQRAGENGIEAS